MKEFIYNEIPDVEKNKVFTTSDLGLATALVCLNFEVKNIDKTIEKRAVFFFDKTEKLEEALKAFWLDTLEVKAQKYFNVLKALKSQIYSRY